MTEVEHIIDRAERQCRTHGSRLTSKRKQVLSALLKFEKALSAYELIDVYKTEYGETLPAMSMYRILDFLEERFLVHKLKLANKYVACAHINCDHDHVVSQFLICGKCQKVTEIGIGKAMMKELQMNVENAGFRLASPQLEMSCICMSCASGAA